MLIIAGMPGGRQFAMLSYSYEPLMREAAIKFHFARYAGVSFGASGPRPCEPSAVGEERVGGGSGSTGRWRRRSTALLRRVVDPGQARPGTGRRRARRRRGRKRCGFAVVVRGV